MHVSGFVSVHLRNFMGLTIKPVDQRSRAVILNLVNHLLNVALDYDAIFTSILELIVPTLADWCVIDSKKLSGNGKKRATAHSPHLVMEQDLGKIQFGRDSAEAVYRG